MFLQKLDFNNQDTRVKKYVMPKKIMKTTGRIINARKLLTSMERQIFLQEKTLTVLTTTPESKAGILLDFGFEFSGGAILGIHTVSGGKEAKIRLSFGESANEALADLGYKGACNDHSPRDFVFSAQNFSVNELGNTGYRFLYIELLTECTVSIKSVQGVFYYQPLEYYGSFECSDPLLNRIYDTAAYTCHLCIQNEIWDGIKRDRLVWVGDMSPEMKTIKYVFGEIPQMTGGLEVSAQHAPLPQWMNTMPTYSLWWLIILEEWCFYTGNYALAQRQREYILGLIQQILANIDSNGVFTAGSFIDWPSNDTSAAVAGTKGLAALCLQACVKLCGYFGEKQLEQQCGLILSKMSACRENCGGMKQIAALLTLAGMADTDCVRVLKQGGPKGFSTFMSYYILTAMARFCNEKQVLGALKKYYGAMLKLGATTFWEDFDISWTENACRIDEICDGSKTDVHGDNGKYCYQGFRHSLCHGWSSGPVPFLTEYVLGVHILESGCKTVELKPHLGDLRYARGSIATPKGKLEVEHIRTEDGKIKTRAVAPKGIRILY